MKEHAQKPVWRTAAGCMAAVMALSALSWTPLTVHAEEAPLESTGSSEVQPTTEPVAQPVAEETEDTSEVLYANPLDSKDGLVHIGTNGATEEDQQWEIVEDEGRKVLRMMSGPVNPGNMYIVDTNASLPAEAVLEFDMKLKKRTSWFGNIF